MEPPVDYMGTYRSIAAKLKKRFMRKPNVSEAAAQFRQLTSSIQRDADGGGGGAAAASPYAALCALAVARCEQSMQRNIPEAEALLAAGTDFVKGEAAERSLSGEGFEHNLMDAIHCYEMAAESYVKAGRRAFAGTLYTELGNMLTVLGHSEEALPYHRKAASLEQQSPLAVIAARKREIDCLLELNRYADTATALIDLVDYAAHTSNAAHLLKKMDDIFLVAGRICPQGAYRSLIAEAEVTAILLALRLPSVARSKLPALETLFMRYATPTIDIELPHMPTELFFHLQAVVFAHEEGNTQNVLLEKPLWPYLTRSQKQLLHEVLEVADAQ